MNAVKEEEISTCYHCGENCDGSIVFQQHRFCCNGCKTVYELLNENNLCSYYDLNQTPGTSLKSAPSNKKFAYLDDAEVKQQLIQFSDDNVSTVTFYIPRIHCSSCLFLLENLHRLKDGVQRCRVNFLKREAHITFDNSKLSLRQVVETLANIGYEPSINLNDLNRKETGQHLRQYYLKIGVAFFAFGNIMLLTFPEYLGIDALTESPFRKFFGYLNFVLALPVLLYSSQEFFVSAWNALKQKALNMDVPIVLGILAMFVRSAYEVFSHTGGGYFDTLASLVLLMLIGRLFQNKTFYTLSFERDYKSYFPVAVTLVNNGTESSIPLTKLRVGDRMLVRNMELIPADAVLIKGKAAIDYSFVTGEASPVAKQSGDLIYAGGRQTGSAIEVEVVKDVSHSYLARLWNDAAFGKSQKQPVTSLATKAGKWFTPVVITIAFIAAAWWWNTDMQKALNAFTSVLIITCPCALALSSPFTLGNVLRILGQHKIYLKNAIAVETLAQIDTIVFDKTGTLTNTKNARIEFVNGANGEATLSDYELQLVKSLVYHSSHPLSRKVCDYLKGIGIIPTEDFKEEEGKGIEGWVDENCVRVGSKKFLIGEENADGSKVSDFRHASKVYVGINGKVRGFFLVKNEYRKGFGELMKSLVKLFSLFVVSGDNDAEKNFLKQYVPENNLIFHQQPADKLEVIKELQASGKKVMMIGDGLNDAGALKQADAGIAISDDVNNFSPACDGIIDSEKFETIHSFLRYCRSAVNIIKVSFAISIAYNIVGVYFAVQGTMSPLVAAVLMPISSVTIIAFTTLSSYLAKPKHSF
ncbi:MAG: heavy metal translocating P-type ATPase metal-binding domain-containing protein [Chitinophagales bacterium]|nr:heavy metal translocating P-type ATPase metal-binding domain-containing protein [Chitinophagales bacterium]